MSGNQLLQDQLTFPDFKSCPLEDEIDPRYYGTDNGFFFKPTRHWCLFAEVLDAFCFFRLRLRVRDRAGNEFLVHFHPEGAEMPALKQYKTGSTIAILYPHKHFFMDGTVGIRQEHMNKIQVIPLGLAEVIKIGQSFGIRPISCPVCKDPKSLLLKCARCRLAWYCGKDCQKKDWMNGDHKIQCKWFSLAQKMLSKDWATFDDWFHFPL